MATVSVTPHDEQTLPVKMYTCNCEKEFREQRTFEQHQSNDCKNQNVECSFCRESVPTTDIREHLLTCGNKTKLCDKCNRYILRGIFSYHYENDCQNPDDENEESALPSSRVIENQRSENDHRSTDNQTLRSHRLINDRPQSLSSSQIRQEQRLVDNHTEMESSAINRTFNSHSQTDTPNNLAGNQTLRSHRLVNDRPQSLSSAQIRQEQRLFDNHTEMELSAVNRTFNSHSQTDTPDNLAGISSNRQQQQTADTQINDIHNDNDRRITCEYCLQPCSFKDYEHHKRHCLRNSDANIRNRKPTDHTDSRQDETNIPCEYCEKLININELQDHTTECVMNLNDIVNRSSHQQFRTTRDSSPRNVSTSASRHPISPQNRSTDEYALLNYLPASKNRRDRIDVTDNSLSLSNRNRTQYSSSEFDGTNEANKYSSLTTPTTAITTPNVDNYHDFSNSQYSYRSHSIPLRTHDINEKSVYRSYNSRSIYDLSRERETSVDSFRYRTYNATYPTSNYIGGYNRSLLNQSRNNNYLSNNFLNERLTKSAYDKPLTTITRRPFMSAYDNIHPKLPYSYGYHYTRPLTTTTDRHAYDLPSRSYHDSYDNIRHVPRINDRVLPNYRLSSPVPQYVPRDSLYYSMKSRDQSAYINNVSIIVPNFSV
ncbi:unnamed protein product [Didymodactylos carnosus]|uniref:TRAF-type domain-containing protein n=1 Tax=Didymodactylos carnosus TaxID=1234261 RepID=A0A8S2CV85_9BILA|nr:unnamed protein product [Didymodactylos carnosus]CAF3596289.1 unnamed protein product [Didymodactylos carnosus]